ncbi:aminotransferase class V-fold PLP-dependent enzyme [Funiculus sociatus GB2-A5]|uniref:Aminotransferase class V-fold PLP-dependent enzyme n=1 Tax=Funiculus sociatus GB2-A5 TaxID=2933946 RepID=A0ABV0JPH8_9CYAN|nr:MULTISPECIES: aminotransferase class V-fold PLP-dependent enzyme [unclassified Trichocoleus]MBD1907560.1 aminotransferase class V-fold PLP-dependent enzyme [Trichocoleus sp. FACHB-832]MBD2062151.1 aminotransferase class V-fold PLP-dependent enzyme [Trichocoleus sp. FACHB-6]
MSNLQKTKDSLESHRQQFPALANKAYFNYGGQGPMPQAALDAIYQSYEYVQRSGPFSTEVNAWVIKEANETRSAIAKSLNVPPETITLTEDVTVGCNIALWGIDWQAGDRLLISDCEHPGIIATVQELQRRFGIGVDCCPLMATLNEGNPVAAISDHLHPKTKMVVLSHLLWNTGQVLPLSEIAEAVRQHSHNHQPVRILVDAAQSVGSLPLNLTELAVDFYAFTGHKWLCGPEGVGGLYVRPEALESLNPTFIGWRSIVPSKSLPYSWQPDGRRYEVATSAYPLYAGLRAAIALHQQWGTPEECYQQIRNLSKYLWQRLAEIPSIQCLRNAPPESGLVSFKLKDKPNHQKLVEFLETQGILVRTINNPDCVRACVHYFTIPGEIDRLIETIQEFDG